MWSICYIFNNDTDANIDFILPGNMLNNNASIYNNNDTPLNDYICIIYIRLLSSLNLSSKTYTLCNIPYQTSEDVY